MSNQIPQKFCWPKLPLAVYREIAAHLCQVEGVEVQFLPQTDADFDYELSQSGGLHLSGMDALGAEAQERVWQILQYYCSTIGDWQVL
jgi:hypothetical protein